MNNPCEKHLNVRASDGYCPICLLDEIAQLRAELDEMREALETYEYAIREAEAILGGEYAMEYGPFFEMVKSARAVLAKYPAHPETKEEK